MHLNTRRTFIQASAAAFSGMTFMPGAVTSFDQTTTAATPGKAKSTILFFLCGGHSHIDTFDPKPNAPTEYRGPFDVLQTSAPGLLVSEHLPMTAKLGHHLAVIRSIDGTVNTNDHHAGYYHNLTGHVPDESFKRLGNNRTPFPDDWPYMGTVIGMKRNQAGSLPNAITLPHMPSRKPYTRPGQFAARIGTEYDPLYLNGNTEQPLEFTAPALTLQGDVTAERISSRNGLLKLLDRDRQALEQYASTQVWKKQQARALELLLSAGTANAFSLEGESEATIERYGKNVNGMSLLMARRLVEVGVPFITVFWKGEKKLADKCKSGGSWDTHGNNFGCLKDDLLPMFDQGYSALLEDLEQRGMLDQTLVMVTSEMGRKPKIGDPRSGGESGQGRDHWTYCLTDVLAGGGIRGGQAYGATDRLGEFPADLECSPADVTATVYKAMGINDLTATDTEGRVYNLLEHGKPLEPLL
ncbi:MAG: hypothetical protein CMM06_11750 [Rhodopirellula sp.]|nr:hypothetical protein [Rhodopirellula sp.]|tara:strand:+ start:4814 stop:6220 length:1407 start_codon:yes stop_codon:yes gene_type:complete